MLQLVDPVDVMNEAERVSSDEDKQWYAFIKNITEPKWNLSVPLW